MPLRPLQSEIGIILGTGPSLDAAAVTWAVDKKRKKGWPLFGVNNIYQIVPEINVHLACNPEWWDEYWPKDIELRNPSFDTWTWHKPTSEKYDIGYIEGRWGDSLSKDPTYIHYGHSSGYQILGLAYHYGIREFYLLGYDMAYPPGKPRHYFGEYPKALYHNPKTGPNGEFLGLIKQFETIDEDDLGIEVINLCQTSALEHFRKGDINDY
jgi:hypothetical protein